MWTADDRLTLIRVKIERANKHIAELEDFLLNSGVLEGKSIRRNTDAEAGNPLLHFGSFHIYEPDIPAIIGDVVHNLRSALDHLAYHLVMVGTDNGEVRTEPWEKIQFPITHSADSYKSKRTAGKVQGMERKAIEAIDALKPYKGGYEPLWLLHKLDNTDKHSFILPIGEDVIIAGVSLRASEPFFTSIGDPKADNDVNFAGEEPLVEPAVGKANAVLPTLHKLSQLVGDIVTSFRPLLEGPVVPAGESSALDRFNALQWPKMPWDDE
jgi:hypothetical protein